MEELRLKELIERVESHLRCLLDSLSRLADGLEGIESASPSYRYCQGQLAYSVDNAISAQANLEQYKHEVFMQACSEPPKLLSEVLRRAFPKEPFQFLKIPPLEGK